MSASVKTAFQTALQAAFNKQFNKTNKDKNPGDSFKEFTQDFCDALFTLLEGQTVTFNKPVTQLFADAVPIPNDGGAAINAQYQVNAETFDNESTVTLT